MPGMPSADGKEGAMNSRTEEILRIVSDWKGSFCGAYSIREDCKGIAVKSTEHVHITPKKDKPGLDIVVDDGTRGETLSIPACVTHGDVDDLVYNDFFIGSDCDVTIVAGCGVHTDNGEPARHNGIHRFFIKDRSKVVYLEKHVGLGRGDGRKSIDPVTEVEIGEDSTMEMETSQIGGVTDTERITRAKVGRGSSFIVHERLLTEKDQRAATEFSVDMDGEGSSVDLISRSVAKDGSHQTFHSVIRGNAACTGHSECDAIITGDATVSASPQLDANCLDAALIHEAAIGKIAGEQLLKLRTFGLTEEEAEERIIQGFLR